MRHRSLIIPCAALGAALPCAAQSLFQAPAAPAPERLVTEGPPAPLAGGAQSLQAVSLYAVEPVQAREFLAEDLVTIIISERSKLDRKQKSESKKDYDNQFAVEQFIDLVTLLEARIMATEEDRLPQIGVNAKTDFKGDAKYMREDRLTDRITAKVLEVKPNGTLVLEARRQWTTDEEDQVVILSGICRTEDVTDRNTVQSNQMYDMALRVENSGELERATRKGVIPRLLEGLFNF